MPVDHHKKTAFFTPFQASSTGPGHQEILKKIIDGCSSVGENAAVAFHCKVAQLDCGQCVSDTLLLTVRRALLLFAYLQLW